jgi:hypothetical protein
MIEEDEVANEPVDQPPTTADAAIDQSSATAPVVPPDGASPPPVPPVTMTRTGPLRALSIIVVVAGAILVVAGVVTWFVVRDQLSDEKIVVSQDAPFLGGHDVNGPLSAYAQAEAINDHALEASGGLTYAELPQDDPARSTVMTASFLRASLFTSVVAFGVALFAVGVGIVLILIGWAMLRIDRALRARVEPAAPA